MILDQSKFLEGMISTWESYGNYTNEKLIRAWKTIHSCYSNQLSGQSGLHVSDSVCGTGKSISVRVACNQIADTAPNVGCLVVVRFINDANEIANEINNAAGSKVAIAFHSEMTKAQLKDLDLSEYQVLVVTHVAYLSSFTGKNKRDFKSWKYGIRKFRVVDESLDLVERHTIARNDINTILTYVLSSKDKYFLKEAYSDEIALLEEVDRFIYGEDYDVGGKQVGILYEKVISKYPNDIKVASILSHIDESNSTDWYLPKKVDFEEFKSTLSELICTFDRVVKLETWAYKSNQSKDTIISAGELVLPDEFPSLCILDATSNIDMVYDLFGKVNGLMNRYSVDRDVRSFRNVKLNVLPMSGLGKGTREGITIKNPKLLEWAQKTFSKNEKVLFAGHKKQMEAFDLLLRNSNAPEDWKVIWWNNIDGRNDFREYENLVITSLLYLPPDHSPTAKLAFKTYQPELEIDGYDDIASSAMATKLIQLLCRIRIRKVIDEEGNCEPSMIYVTLEGKSSDVNVGLRGRLTKRGEFLLSSIEKSLCDIQVTSWSNFLSNGGGRKSILIDKFLTWISFIQPGETLDLNSFISSCENDAEARAIRNHLANPTSTPRKVLNDLGIIRIAKTKSGTTFHLPAAG